jgi:hypothetical protein
LSCPYQKYHIIYYFYYIKNYFENILPRVIPTPGRACSGQFRTAPVKGWEKQEPPAEGIMPAWGHGGIVSHCNSK